MNTLALVTMISVLGADPGAVPEVQGLIATRVTFEEAARMKIADAAFIHSPQQSGNG